MGTVAGGRAGVSGAVTTRGHVVIDVDACKGCDLCIDACPPRVLVMTTHEVNATGYRYPLLLPGCTGCKACSQICPDFVFQVYKLAEPVEIALDEGDGA
jgi:2-oxoglutarate ferredoxin oxidoreductase subunit delta